MKLKKMASTMHHAIVLKIMLFVLLFCYLASDFYGPWLGTHCFVRMPHILKTYCIGAWLSCELFDTENIEGTFSFSAAIFQWQRIKQFNIA